MALVTVGLTASLSALFVHINSEVMYFLVPGLWFGGAAMVGAGVGMLLPFEMPSIGAILGAMLGVAAQVFITLLLSPPSQ
jgi:hypothetical protein